MTASSFDRSHTSVSSHVRLCCFVLKDDTFAEADNGGGGFPAQGSACSFLKALIFLVCPKTENMPKCFQVECFKKIASLIRV